MERLKINIDEALLFLLRPRNRQGTIEYCLERKASVKDIIESLRIPHTEVGRIDADGREVDFSYIPQFSQTLRVSAIKPPLDVTRCSRLRPQPLHVIRFIADVNVGKLAALLRMLGFDTLYSRHLSDPTIARLAEQENRIVLSKDRELFKRSRITFGRLVRAIHPDDQLAEVVRFFGLKGPFSTFSRCLICNNRLEPVQKEAILHRLEPKTRKYFNGFKICRHCHRIYWRGSHYDEMILRLQKAGLDIVPSNQR